MAPRLPRVAGASSAREHCICLRDDQLDDCGLPAEELLRLDDGTPLPPELAELRTLLQVHASLAGVVGGGGDDDDDERLRALQEAKAEKLRDCLMLFDDFVLFLHDRVLDHEALVRRVTALRKRGSAKPAGRMRFDEAIELGDDGDGELTLRELLEDGGEAAGAWCEGAGASAEDDKEAAAEEDDEEVLDQRLATSRQQIKRWVRALQTGWTGALPPPPTPALGAAAPPAEARAPAPPPPPPNGAEDEVHEEVQVWSLEAPTRPSELAAVVPPPRGSRAGRPPSGGAAMRHVEQQLLPPPGPARARLGPLPPSSGGGSTSSPDQPLASAIGGLEISGKAVCSR